MLEEIARQRQLSPDERSRVHSIEVKPTLDGEDEDGIPGENIPGLAKPLLDMIWVDRESEVDDMVRSVPRLIIYDVSPTELMPRGVVKVILRHSMAHYRRRYETSSPNMGYNTFRAYTSLLQAARQCSGKLSSKSRLIISD